MSGQMTLFSLFSGAGGLDLGFRQSGGFKILFANDILDVSMETYSSNFKIKKVDHPPDSSELPALYPEKIENLDFGIFEDVNPDVVAGGPPCQDFSIVRGPTAEGTAVSRGKLYSYFIKGLMHLRPKMFVFENVPGLTSINKGRTYDTILDDFSGLKARWREEIRDVVKNNSNMQSEGYKILYEGVVDASRLGIPQARKRVIIIGLRKDLWKSAWGRTKYFRQKKKIKNTLEGNNSILGKYPLTSMEALEGRPLPDLQSEYKRMMQEYKDVAEEVNTETSRNWKKEVYKKLSFDPVEDYLRANEIDPEGDEELEEAVDKHTEVLKELGYFRTKVSEIPPDKNNKQANETEDVEERMKRIPPDQNHKFVDGTKWSVKGRGMSLVYRRIHPLKPSYTVVAKGGGGTWGYHYKRSRGRLTNRERARLQTFPDDFIFTGSKTEVRSQIGESVPPLLGRKIGEIVAKILEGVS